MIFPEASKRINIFQKKENSPNLTEYKHIGFFQILFITHLQLTKIYTLYVTFSMTRESKFRCLTYFMSFYEFRRSEIRPLLSLFFLNCILRQVRRKVWKHGWGSTKKDITERASRSLYSYTQIAKSECSPIKNYS